MSIFKPVLKKQPFNKCLQSNVPLLKATQKCLMNGILFVIIWKLWVFQSIYALRSNVSQAVIIKLKWRLNLSVIEIREFKQFISMSRWYNLKASTYDHQICGWCLNIKQDKCLIYGWCNLWKIVAYVWSIRVMGYEYQSLWLKG